MTRRIHYTLIGCKRITPKNIKFCFILYSPFIILHLSRDTSVRHLRLNTWFLVRAKIKEPNPSLKAPLGSIRFNSKRACMSYLLLDSCNTFTTKTNFSNEKVKCHQIQPVKYAVKPFLMDTLMTTNLLLRDKLRRPKLIPSLFIYINQKQTPLQS